MKSLSEKSFQESDGYSDSLVPDPLAMITDCERKRPRSMRLFIRWSVCDPASCARVAGRRRTCRNSGSLIGFLVAPGFLSRPVVLQSPTPDR